jgi:uncharacterized OsmC-like protein
MGIDRKGTGQKRKTMKINTEQGQKSEESRQFSVSLDYVQDYEFRVKFDKADYQDLMIDETPPVGHDKGPNPSRLIAAAIGGCLSASLLFSARKLRLNLSQLHTNVKVQHARNEKGRLRIDKIDVEITPGVEPPDPEKLRRCADLFEDFCVVTQSVRKGIDISVAVKS